MIRPTYVVLTAFAMALGGAAVPVPVASAGPLPPCTYTLSPPVVGPGGVTADVQHRQIERLAPGEPTLIPIKKVRMQTPTLNAVAVQEAFVTAAHLGCGSGPRERSAPPCCPQHVRSLGVLVTRRKPGLLVLAITLRPRR